jgi:hypothetical protein
MPGVVIGHYYFKSEIPVNMTYTTPDGDITETTDYLNIYFEIKENDYPELFKYNIEIISEEKQTITIYAEFEESDEFTYKQIYLNNYSIGIYYKREMIYYTPWNEKRVSIGVSL